MFETCIVRTQAANTANHRAILQRRGKEGTFELWSCISDTF